MRVTSLQINGLKAHKSLTLEEFDSAVLVNGRNGSGKSTILEAISFLFGGGIRGESVDGRNMIALVNGNEGVSVSATLEHGGDVAKVRRYRSPTASGLSRSKIEVELLSGESDALFRRALSGSLVGVSHAHDWLSIKWSDLRSLIVELGSTDIEQHVPRHILQMIDRKNGVSDGVRGLQARLQEDLRSKKRDLKALEQSAQSLADNLEPASPEEREAVRVKKAGIESKVATLGNRRLEVFAELTDLRMRRKRISDNPIATGERTLESVSDELGLAAGEKTFGVYNHESALRFKLADLKDAEGKTQGDLLLLKSLGLKRREELETLKPLTVGECHSCPYCKAEASVEIFQRTYEVAEKDLNELDGKAQFTEMILLDMKANVQTVETELRELQAKNLVLSRYISEMRESYSKTGVSLHEAYLEALERERYLETELEMVEASQKEQSALLVATFGDLSKIESLLSQHRIASNAGASIGKIKEEINTIKATLLTVESIIGTIARGGKQRIEEKVLSYYGSNTLGQPFIDMNQGKIGLMRGDVFYAGIALSGAERDLLATAIDCAIKELQGIPRVILIEAESLDPVSLTTAMNTLKSMQADGMIDQIVVTTWAEVDPPLHSHSDWQVIYINR